MEESIRTGGPRRRAGVWLVVGGAFILVPGIALFYFLGFPALLYFVWLGGSAPLLWIPFLLITLGPPVALLVAGVWAIAAGVRRRSAAGS